MFVGGTHLHHYGYLKAKTDVDKKHNYYAKLCAMDIGEDPKNYKSYFNLATHYYHTKDFNKAKDLYSKTLELNPKQWLAWHEYGVVLYRDAMSLIENELEQVKLCFDNCKKYLPKDANKDYISQIENNYASVAKLLKTKSESEHK
jgi:tetratricopeptide (TPR) repeat protein